MIFHDSWLRLAELNKINVLLDEVLDYVWKTFYDKSREKHEKINIDKDKDIDEYVSKYTNIVNDNLELVKRIGELLDSAMIEVQNEAGMINDAKQASDIYIDTLKLVNNTLAKILKKWRDIVLETINKDDACSKPKDTKKKDNKLANQKKANKPDIKKKVNKPDTKKKDNEPDTKKKDNEPDIKKKVNKPDTKKKDNKPDTKKKDNKPDTKKDNKPDTKKDNKPDTKKKDMNPDKSKNNIENRASNRIKYEIQDIAKYRKVLIKMIDERMNMLDLINLRLAESIADTDIGESRDKFFRLCIADRIKKIRDMMIISRIYAVNVALECLRDGVGNGIWPKGISYNLITIVDEWGLRRYYDIITRDKIKLIDAARKEIEMVRRLIETNMNKYENIITGAREMDIYALNDACADIDIAIGYIRKIIMKIPSIVEKKLKIDTIKENENRYDKGK